MIVIMSCESRGERTGKSVREAEEQATPRTSLQRQSLSIVGLGRRRGDIFLKEHEKQVMNCNTEWQDR